MNQSSACWVLKANPQRGLWMVPKADQPFLVVVVVVVVGEEVVEVVVQEVKLELELQR